jgi:hypothetical protein
MKEEQNRKLKKDGASGLEDARNCGLDNVDMKRPCVGHDKRQKDFVP